ncbi:hypothetical protein FG386_003616 [Cryptosporidium ryanae]|uniref:uncharacterized protein n=1 Tax=Cryptosporidium ryanae TaxID=515981 RepID=UPI00351A4CAB|nr:hypothetical protein FG386_003616 [Cryptosporidium ryanae]
MVKEVVIHSVTENSKKMRTDTVGAVFDGYWDAPKNSCFSSRYLSKTKNPEITEESFQEHNSFNSHSEDYSPLSTVGKSDVELSESKDSTLEKFPSLTTVFSEIKPKKWVIEYSKINSEDISEKREKRKYIKKKSDLSEEDDIPFNEIQYMWLSNTNDKKKTKLNTNINSDRESLLEDPNETSPITINFPHPIQLQNASLPFEILDTRSVPCGTFVWWDRRVWEYNFVQMARRLSTNQEKACKKLKIETNSNGKRK